jgi:hypothetical protein
MSSDHGPRLRALLGKEHADEMEAEYERGPIRGKCMVEWPVFLAMRDALLRASASAPPENEEANYWGATIGCLADEVARLKAEEFLGRRDKWVSVLRNAAYRLNPASAPQVVDYYSKTGDIVASASAPPPDDTSDERVPTATVVRTTVTIWCCHVRLTASVNVQSPPPSALN